MLLSDLTGKEVINLGDGSKIGVISECDLIFDVKTGKITSLVVPSRGFFNFFNDNHSSNIPWEAVKRIGDEVIIVDLDNSFSALYPKTRSRLQER